MEIVLSFKNVLIVRNVRVIELLDCFCDFFADLCLFVRVVMKIRSVGLK